LGSGERSAALPLQSLSAHVQRPDENAVGEFAYEDKWAAQTEAMIDGVSTRSGSRCGVH